MVTPAQILPGHILLVLRQPNVAYTHTSNYQMFDLSLAIKELTEMLHASFKAQRISTTTIVKDVDSQAQVQTASSGKLSSGQIAPSGFRQLYVHLIPRQSTHNMSNEELDACLLTFEAK